MTLDDYEKQVEQEQRMYSNARAEHALRCRLDGETYKEIGVRLGVGSGQARSLAHKGDRMRRTAMLRIKQ